MLTAAVLLGLMLPQYLCSPTGLYTRNTTVSDKTIDSTANSTKASSGQAFSTIDCSIPEITDATIDPAKRWAAVDSDDAWKDAVDYAASKVNTPDAGGLSFPELISNRVHGPENMQCDNLAARSSCGQSVQCWNKPAAGFFIANSMIGLANLNYNTWDAIAKAESDVLASIGVFSSTFAVQNNDDEIFFKILTDILGLTFALYVAPLWNIAFKQLPYFSTHGNELGTLKDTINPMVSNTVTLVKDAGITGASLNAQNKLSDNVGQLVIAWEGGINAFNKKLFDGSSDSVDMLNKQVANGKLIAGNIGLDEAAAKTNIEKALFAALMPRAWADSNNDVHPFILDSGAACGTQNPVSKDYLDPAVGNIAWSCVNNKIYYLLAVAGETGECVSPGGGTPYCDDKTFGMPPGGNSLDGQKWGGLTLNDVITGAMNTFSTNGNKNGASEVDLSNSDTISSIGDNGVLTPGVFIIPVCGAKEAYGNWAGKKKTPNYPCN